MKALTDTHVSPVLAVRERARVHIEVHADGVACMERLAVLAL